MDLGKPEKGFVNLFDLMPGHQGSIDLEKAIIEGVKGLLKNTAKNSYS